MGVVFVKICLTTVVIPMVSHHGSRTFTSPNSLPLTQIGQVLTLSPTGRKWTHPQCSEVNHGSYEVQMKYALWWSPEGKYCWSCGGDVTCGAAGMGLIG